MFEEITYMLVFGLPLIVYSGIFALILFFSAAALVHLKRKGKVKIAVQWHFRLAYLALFIGLFHAVFALLAYV